MANSLVGLIGPGIGPQLRVAKFRNKLEARICGLSEGQFVEVLVVDEAGTDQTLKFESNGDFELPMGDWVCFRHKDGKSKNLVCFVRGY